MRMGPHETPPSSPYMEEYVEEIDENDLESLPDADDVEVLESYEVEENDEDGGEQMMAEDGEVVEVMERDDSICIFDKHIASVFCGSLSKDGQYAVTGGEDDKAYVWDVKTAKVILECTDHKDSVIFANFSHDDKYLATGDMNGIIQVRNTSDKAVIWDYNMGDATWMKWHPVAHVLLAGGVEGEVYMWKIPDGECKIVQGFGKRAETSSLMADGKRLVVGYEDGVIRIIDLKTCTVAATIPSNQGHNLAITALDCHQDNNLILSAAVDGKTILSAANSGKVVHCLQDLNHPNAQQNDDESGGEESTGNWVEDVCFFKDANQYLAATGTLNGEIYIWDTSRKTIRHAIDQGSGISKLLWMESTPLLFTAGLDGILRVYDARSAECRKTFLGHTEDILDLCISKDSRIILTTSDDTSARIFELDTDFSSLCTSKNDATPTTSA